MKCPKCQGFGQWDRDDQRFKCLNCGRSFTATEGVREPDKDVEVTQLRSTAQELAQARPFVNPKRAVSPAKQADDDAELEKIGRQIRRERSARGAVKKRRERKEPVMAEKSLCQQCRQVPPSPGHGRCDGCLKKMREAYHARKAKAGKRTAPSRAVERERERERERITEYGRAADDRPSRRRQRPPLRPLALKTCNSPFHPCKKILHPMATASGGPNGKPA